MTKEISSSTFEGVARIYSRVAREKRRDCHSLVRSPPGLDEEVASRLGNVPTV